MELEAVGQSDMLGEMIGDRYRVIRKLGEGGMAIVYLAVDEKLGRNVAVKFLREKFQSHQEIRTRFQHEARAISGFDHPNILKVYDYSGANSSQLWIVTELIHGRNLGQIVETAPGGWLHPVIASCIVRETCKALSLAHSEGIVHRDVKPDNVMITQHGVIKLMDFGIAKIQKNISMTQTGMFMGSPSYMSPEQVRGRDIDHRSDIYSLGVLFYELVTGRLPFSGQSTADVAMKILTGQYQHPKFLKDHLPVELNDLIVSMMSLEAPHRPQSTDTVGGIIDKFLERNGFETSQAELDRCFRDPKSYGERLAKLIQQTVMVAMPTQILEPSARMDAATRLPGSMPSPQRKVQAHNEAAIDQPRPYVPSNFVGAKSNQTNVQASINSNSNTNTNVQNPHPAHAVPPPPMRRDHALPRNSLPHVSKKAVGSPDVIMAHLPERRLHQRPEQTVVKTPPRPAARPRPAPKPIAPRPKAKAAAPRPPRSLPRVPHRSPQRYVVHREITLARESNSNWLLLVIALAVGFIFYALFGDRLGFGGPTSPLSLIHSNNNGKYTHGKPKPGSHQKPITETNKRDVDKKKDKEITSAKPDDVSRKPSGQKISASPIDRPVATKQEPKFDRHSDSQPDATRYFASQATAKPYAAPIATVGPTEAHPSPKMPVTTVSNSDQDPVKNPPLLDPITLKPAPPRPSEPKTQATTTSTAPNSSESKPGKAAIAVSANPAAEVFVNGRKVGTTNDAGLSSDWIELSSGKFKIELRRSGFATRTEMLTVSAGERKRLGPYSLTRESTKVVPSTYRLTLYTNLPPTQVTVINSETKVSKAFILNASSQTISLDRGIYDVVMKHGNDIRKRRIDMTGSETQLTFSSEYKEESH